MTVERTTICNEHTGKQIEQLESELHELLEQELRCLDALNAVTLASYKRFFIWALQHGLDPKDYRKRSAQKAYLKVFPPHEGAVVMPHYTLTQPYPMVFKVGVDDEWVTIWSKDNLPANT